MRFGPLPVADAEGAILAHAVEVEGRRLRKAARLGPGDIAALVAAGVAEVVAARLEAGDVGEDEAAARLAGALQPAGIEIRPAATGRANLHARPAGVFRADRALIDGSTPSIRP